METGVKINNAIYDELGERWYTAEDDPIALLRAESRLRNPWVLAEMTARLGGRSLRVLDVGCGAGFLSNFLGQAGHRVVGVDLSLPSLAVAQAHDTTRAVRYLQADAYQLPVMDGTLDVVCAMDFLEHIDDPQRLVAEVSRTLAPGGLFFFHTFNRNLISGALVIKGVERFVKNVPAHLHAYKYFIKPSELSCYCQAAGMAVGSLRGMRPQVFSRAFFKLLRTGTVAEDFRFVFTRSKLTGYVGVAIKT